MEAKPVYVIPSDSLSDVLEEVAAERERQDGLWGEQNHSPFKWLSILSEEMGEVARAINEGHWNGANWKQYRKELVQVAAVAVAMIESFDRNGPDNPKADRYEIDGTFYTQEGALHILRERHGADVEPQWAKLENVYQAGGDVYQLVGTNGGQK